MFDEKHRAHLMESYNKVGHKIENVRDFSDEDLAESLLLFDPESLLKGAAQPIDVDVYAVLSGISFEKEFLRVIDNIYAQLRAVLSDKRYYLVKRDNLGIEYAVLKWPQEKVDHELIKSAISLLREYPAEPFSLKVCGIQLHRDGCVILKCVDEGASVFKIRDFLRTNLPNLPKRQSSWCHIPLGRVLEPIGLSQMNKLKATLAKIDDELDYDIPIREIHLVNEKTWYMESKDYLYTKVLRQTWVEN